MQCSCQRRIVLTIFTLAIVAFSSTRPLKSETLDDKFHEIKQYGGLKQFCEANPAVEECSKAIGEWKPAELEKVKSSAIQCFDQCPADTFGFVRSPDGSREYPEINTKDFDGFSPSRGVEFKLYPVSLFVLKYDGCAGCSLVKETPISVVLEFNRKSITLPMLGYGVFYLPRTARSLASEAARANASLKTTLTFSKSKEKRQISKVATAEYYRMLESLNYTSLR